MKNYTEMNQFRKNTKDYQEYYTFLPTYRNKSPSPMKKSRIPGNINRVAFADNFKPNFDSPRRKDSLPSIFLKHLRQQLPKTIEDKCQTITIHKNCKNNQNLTKKLNHNENNALYPKLKYKNKNKDVYFEDEINKFSSSSEGALSSNLNSTPCRIQSVRNVIEKFNKLSNPQTNIASKQSFKNKKMDYNFENEKYDQKIVPKTEFKPKNDKNSIDNDEITLKQSFRNKKMNYWHEYDQKIAQKSEFIPKNYKNSENFDEINSRHSIKEKKIEFYDENDGKIVLNKVKQSFRNKKMNYWHEYDQKIAQKSEFIPKNYKNSENFGEINSRHSLKEKKIEFYDENDGKMVLNKVNSKISHIAKHDKIQQHINKTNKRRKKQQSIQLRSQRFHKEKENGRLICDDLLQIFTSKNKTENISSNTAIKILQMEKSGKELVSIETQTTPCCSATNIMINVYDQKSPRWKNKNMQVQISEDNNYNTTVYIDEKEKIEKRDAKVTKQNVKACIETFEENLKKRGMDISKDTNDGKIFSKIRSNYLLKQNYEPKLSPKAKSVPF